jgi:hypothetical protein
MAEKEKPILNRRAILERELELRKSKKKSIAGIVKESAISAAKTTGNEAKSILNQMLLGLPDVVSKQKTGKPFVEGKTTMAGKILGSLYSPASKIGEMVGSVVKGAKAIPSMARAGVQGGTTGFVAPPMDGNFEDLKARGKQAVAGALVGIGIAGLQSAASTVQSVVDPTKNARRLRFIRNRFSKIKRGAVNKFGADLDDLVATNPDNKMSLRDLVDDINSKDQGYTDETIRLLKRSPKMKQLLEDPKLANELSVKDAQEIINSMNDKVPANIRYKDLDFLDVQTSVKAAQLDAFPEMEAVRKAYSEVITPYNQVKSQFRFNRLQKAIVNDFGGSEGKDAVLTLFSKDPKSLKAMGGVKGATNSLKLLKKLRDSVIIGGGIATGVRAGLSPLKNAISEAGGGNEEGGNYN